MPWQVVFSYQILLQADIRKAVDEGNILMSESTLFELADVLGKKKNHVYVSIQDWRVHSSVSTFDS